MLTSDEWTFKMQKRHQRKLSNLIHCNLNQMFSKNKLHSSFSQVNSVESTEFCKRKSVKMVCKPTTSCVRNQSTPGRFQWSIRFSKFSKALFHLGKTPFYSFTFWSVFAWCKHVLWFLRDFAWGILLMSVYVSLINLLHKWNVDWTCNWKRQE